MRIIIIITLALSFIAGILVLTTDFGGMTIRDASGGYGASYYDRWASLGSTYSETADNIFIVVFAICLFIMAFLSLIPSISKQANTRKFISPARILAIFTTILAIVSAVVYNLIRDDMGYYDWWMETGFYAVLVAGIINSILYSIVLFKQPKPVKTDAKPEVET